MPPPPRADTIGAQLERIRLERRAIQLECVLRRLGEVGDDTGACEELELVAL